MVRLRIWERSMEMSVNSKAEIRKRMLAQRKLLLPEERARWDEEILMQCKTLSCLETAKAVYCYRSVRGEAGTDRFISWLRSKKVRVAFPRVCGPDMAFYYCETPEDFKKGAFGILEPASHCERAEEMTAPVIVPGVAFSSDFGRIGYGAGYYDRFFAREGQHKKIAVCYSFQLVESFAAEEQDIPMDFLITEQGIRSRVS